MADAKLYQGIMVSSTFTDLEEHRQEVIEAIEKLDYHPVVMESHGARTDADVIDASLQMVGKSAAYVGLISSKYGQTPYCAARNPGKRSITELEFDEATRLGRPILLFIMGEDHQIKKADVETDPEKMTKLDAFRERAKRMRPDGEVQRVYCVFNSKEDLAKEAAIALAKLNLQPPTAPAPPPVLAGSPEPPLSNPPELRAVPPYLGSHRFVGRKAQLQTLDDWSAAADPNPILLYEAMGGSGKSMLTWEWLNHHVSKVRTDWAGRFWYSFYEQGAVMSGFCRAALEYVTGAPARTFDKQPMSELAARLLVELDRKPWLLVLDGLERILVAYHRIDAPQLADEDADKPTDEIGNRPPTQAIRPEDDEFLRKLAAVKTSKLLVTTRLTPLAFLNKARMPLPGVRREPLPGLRPPDAEELIRACGITGDGAAIQAYLQTNCDCHPLVVGALAGLINDYLPALGDFDKWAADPAYGGSLNLADLDLTQKRNHILRAAIDALSPPSLQLMQTLALLHGGADYEALKAFNPHLPPRPDKVCEPEDPTTLPIWNAWSDVEKKRWKEDYREQIEAWQAFQAALAAWKASSAFRDAPVRLDPTVKDLIARGLLQYDRDRRRYDLHPVVRGVVAGQLSGETTGALGQKVVDHFNARSHLPWDQADTLADLEPGLQVVRTLLQMGDFVQAMSAYMGDLSTALLFNLRASTEQLVLLKPFFPAGWDADPVPLFERMHGYILNDVALAIQFTDENCAYRLLERAITFEIQNIDYYNIQAPLSNFAVMLSRAGKIASATRVSELVHDLTQAQYLEEAQGGFPSQVILYRHAVTCGDHPRADALWEQLAASDRDWGRAVYRPGDAEYRRAADLFLRGELTDADLQLAERLAGDGRNRSTAQDLHLLRGHWHMARSERGPAAASLGEAVRMAREVGEDNITACALLAVARLRLGESFDAAGEAERLGKRVPHNVAVAELWRELGEREKAIAQGLRAHRWAVADGEPYVFRYELDRARKLLTDLGEPLPEVPRYDPAKAEVFPWEADVRAVIDKLNAERAAKAGQDDEHGGDDADGLAARDEDDPA